MREAFDAAWASLVDAQSLFALQGQADRTREALMTFIIAAGAEGLTDVNALRTAALARLTGSEPTTGD
jgi:hypothetical protein